METNQQDNLAPMRGCINGLLICIPLWALIIWAITAFLS